METDRIILHVDQNCFFASVEMKNNPELRNVPMAVAGDAKQRHGIILAKNPLAQRCGVKTAEAIWQSKQKCPDLVVVPGHFESYNYYSRRLVELYSQYTDLVEPFGLDECWLDVTASGAMTGQEIADEIRNRVKDELGLTCSVGVSFNKVFAKLGSDYKKPDATTVILREHFKEIVWPLPVADLLYVGRSTDMALKKINVRTIGELAALDQHFLSRYMGKAGEVLWIYANGLDESPVARIGTTRTLKSVGNSTTTPRDMVSNADVHTIMVTLSAQVGHRLRKHYLRGSTVQIWVRDIRLQSFERQRKLEKATNEDTTIANVAFALFMESYDWHAPLRSIGVRVTQLSDIHDYEQTTIFEMIHDTTKLSKVNEVLDRLRNQYGYHTVMKGRQLQGVDDLSPENRETVPHGAFNENE
ncbi:MAG TPA: DNA polymerase IV [Bacillota bacterium]|nr:DNA polymerase IV [Bacillota bacterium]HPE38986.1 DNA polymerase IV [Bacillota bacterium]